MKKRILALLFLAALLLSACTSKSQPPEVQQETPAPTEEPSAPTPEPVPEPTEEAAEEPAAETEEPASEGMITAGIVDGKTYRSDFFGIMLTLDESWEVPDREEYPQNISSGSYGTGFQADIVQTLENGAPYVDFWAGKGLAYLTILCEKPPVTALDGTVLQTTAEYMDYHARSVPQEYTDLGFTVTQEQRYQTQLCARDFEAFAFTSESGSVKMFQTMMITEKDGFFFVIYITSIQEDESAPILELFTEIPAEQEG